MVYTYNIGQLFFLKKRNTVKTNSDGIAGKGDKIISFIFAND